MNVNEALFELKEQLINEPIVKEYFRLLSLIENDEQLSILDKEIKLHQKLMSTNMNNDEIYFKEKEIYESKLNQYNNHPLIINFNNTKDEVASLLQQIEQILQ